MTSTPWTDISDISAKETVSFLEYMKEAAGEGPDGRIPLRKRRRRWGARRPGHILDEPQRLSEKAGVVETEFRESMSHRLEKGVSASGTDGSFIFRKGHAGGGPERRSPFL